MSKLKRTAYELLMGGKAYLPKDMKTVRTKDINVQLGTAAVDWEKEKPSAKLKRRVKK